MPPSALDIITQRTKGKDDNTIYQSRGGVYLGSDDIPVQFHRLEMAGTWTIEIGDMNADLEDNKHVLTFPYTDGLWSILCNDGNVGVFKLGQLRASGVITNQDILAAYKIFHTFLLGPGGKATEKTSNYLWVGDMFHHHLPTEKGHGLHKRNHPIHGHGFTSGRVFPHIDQLSKPALVKRQQVLLGEVHAGNDSGAIIDELSQIDKKLKS